MNITESKLKQIILEEIEALENYSAAAGANLRAAGVAGNRDSNETVPVDDEDIRAIFSAMSKDKLNEEILTEDMKDRVRDLVNKLGGGAAAIAKVAKRLSLPIALVASIAGGGLAGEYLANTDSTSSDNTELSVQDDAGADELGISDIAGTAYDGEQFSGMKNSEKVEKAWEQYDLSADGIESAPVSSSVWIYKYSMIPLDQMDNNSILPLSGASAGDYYNFLKDRVNSNPLVELPLLKNMVYGDVGKWSGGTGDNKAFKTAEDGSQILPPDWTVAFTVYADLIEEKTIELIDYHIDNPDDRQQLYQQLGVQDEGGFNDFTQSTLSKIGRPLQER